MGHDVFNSLRRVAAAAALTLGLVAASTGQAVAITGAPRTAMVTRASG
ncbi:MAG: hypothetical protein IPM08_14215 [Actinomycetales bacterium]|nr:hypothetical protein [Actinomycetales bacterium]